MEKVQLLRSLVDGLPKYERGSGMSDLAFVYASEIGHWDAPTDIFDEPHESPGHTKFTYDYSVLSALDKVPAPEKVHPWRPPTKAALHNYRAEKAGCRGDLTDAQWADIKRRFGYKCAYCGNGERRLVIEHVEAISNGGHSSANNIVPACGPCNISKSNHNPFSWCKKKGYLESFAEACIAASKGPIDTRRSGHGRGMSKTRKAAQ